MANKSRAAVERETASKVKDSLPERESYTAKQVATRCGTDAKTLRKFLRSNASSAEPVGQGGRYEFDSDTLPSIKQEFEAWRKKSEARRTSTPNGAKVKVAPIKKLPVIEHEGVDFDDDPYHEPTPEELAELELDLDDLELDEDEED